MPPQNNRMEYGYEYGENAVRVYSLNGRALGVVERRIKKNRQGRAHRDMPPGELIERCITAECMWCENVEKVDRLNAEIKGLQAMTTLGDEAEFVRLNELLAAYRQRVRRNKYFYDEKVWGVPGKNISLTDTELDAAVLKAAGGDND